jgi:hypothetical protein
VSDSDWNAALDAARRAAEQAPCFSLDETNPAVHGAVIVAMDIIVREIDKLRRPPVGAVEWNDQPFVPSHAGVDGILLEWNPESGLFRDKDGNTYTLTLT